MSDSIAVINAGSSSIKFSLFAEGGSELELKAGLLPNLDGTATFG